MATQCLIEANPDIAGVGVRVAIYLQAMFALVPGALAFVNLNFKSPTPSADSSELVEISQTTFSILFTGTALLVSTVIQAKAFGLTVYHAIIVLNLSWLNNISALSSMVVKFAFNIGNYNPDGTVRSPWKVFLDTIKTKEFVAYTAHFCATGGIGIWVFSDISTFGLQPECTPSTLYWVFGHDVSVANPTFRRFWLAMYSFALAPIINCEMVILAFTAIGLSAFLSMLFVSFLFCCCFLAGERVYTRVNEIVSGGLFTIAALFIDILLILTTEKIIAHNDVGGEESQWTFGQTLALMVMLLPAWGIWKHFKSVWDRRSRRKAQKEDDLQAENKAPIELNEHQRNIDETV